MEMDDQGYEPETTVVPTRPSVAGDAVPDFHIYRIQLKELNCLLALLGPAVRTPFTLLLDAAAPVWVLPLHCRLTGTPANRQTVA